MRDQLTLSAGKGLRVLLLLLLFACQACTFHSYFPFICFNKGCVNGGGALKAMKQRVKGKLFVMQRKRSKKPIAKAKTSVGNDAEQEALKGKNVEYYRYLLLFRLKQEPSKLDSLVVEHTSEYNTLIAVDQSRLCYKLDTLRVKNVVTVYIKDHFKKSRTEGEHLHVNAGRRRAVRRFLHQQGIPLAHIKILQDSLSPPRL